MSKECPVLDERCPHLKIHYGRGWVEYCCGLPHPEEDCDDYIYYNGEDDEQGEIISPIYLKEKIDS